MGVIIAFLLAAFVIGWFIGRLRQRRHREQREEKKRNELSKRVFRRWRGS
jgi:biotin transporter BioY